MKSNILKFVGLFIAAFGLLTLFLSTSIILDLFGIRAKEGNYVLFIVWVNFICSLLYLLAGIGFIKFKSWTTYILLFSTLILVAGFIGLMIHINAGGIYESKTIGAMLFRISITIIFTLISYFKISKKNI